MSLLQIAFITYLAVLMYFGFLTRTPNWLGWFMFARPSFCYAKITCGERNVNIWAYLPHCQVIVHKPMIEALLQYLRVHHGLYPLSGTIVLHTANGTEVYRVRNAWLI